MKRSIILFLVTFLITAGIGGGIYYAISQGLIPGVTLVPRAEIPTEPQTPTVSETTTPAVPETPTTPEVTTPAVTETPATPAEVPTTVTEPTEPTTTDEAPTATDTPPSEATTEQPTAPEQPEVKEQETGRLIIMPSEKPRNEEHKAALIAREALKAEDPAAAMQHLVERGSISSEAAAALLEWGKNNTPGNLEEVGNSRRDDGDRVTRYRLKSENGTEDALIDVVTNRNGIVIVDSVKTASSDKTNLTAESDHMTVSEGFVEAVRSGDMSKACELTTGTEVSLATVAGLCMVFEEDNFKLREHAPIRNAFCMEDNAGNLVYVVSTENNEEAKISLELTRTEPGWRVKAVGLEGLLSSYENSAHAEGDRYFPIVKNPKGGDSLALFFGFNESDLTPRSLRQLQIVAELLKQTKGKLNISGHTDDVGSEQYNLRLSERRAEAVKAALVAFGTEASQITTHGLGKSQPRRTYNEEDSEQTVDIIRGENRRAEIYLDFES
ncbi:MAG: OmpA family protein [Akkermansia sp.]|nr:OmpA family protein [Akkermansia sp.]